MENQFLINVRKLATKRGMNVSQLEARVGCSQGSAWNIKSTNNKWVEGFAKELHVPVSELFKSDEEPKQAPKPVVPGAVARKDVKKTVEQLGSEINKYYAPGSDWLPQWLDKPDLLAPDMSRNIINELLHRIKKLKAMPLDSVDLSLDAAKELKSDIDKQAEKADVQLDFYKQQNKKLVDDKSDLESSRQSLIKRNNELNHNNIDLKRENELLSEKEKNATYNMRTFEKKLKKQDEDAAHIKRVEFKYAELEKVYKSTVLNYSHDEAKIEQLEGQIEDLTKQFKLANQDRIELRKKLSNFSMPTSEQYKRLRTVVSGISPKSEMKRLSPDLSDDFTKIVEIGIQIGLRAVKSQIDYMVFYEEMEELSKGGAE